MIPAMYDDDADPSWFSNLFVHPDTRQDRRLRRLSADAEVATYVAETNSQTVKALRERTARLELLCESLVELVVIKGLVSREELGVLVAQVDLRDGVEDGALDPDRPRLHAPLCTSCQRPVNPRRPACVYCGAAIEKSEAPTKRPTKLVTCGGCQQQVDQRETNFTESGLRCDRCYRP